MARTKSLNIQLNGSTEKEQLAEVYGAVVDNVALTAVSVALKNNNLSGEPAGGSVEVKRFTNAVAKAYGTARGAGKGDALKAEPVTVNLNTHKEIVEEFEGFDVVKYGVPSLVAKRAGNHVETMGRDLDSAFFACAVQEGSSFTATKTKKVQVLEELVAAIESTKNDYVDGVDRADIAVTLSVNWASELRNELDELPNGMEYKNGIIGQLHGFDVYTSNRLPEGVSCVAMRYESIAQPCMISQYKAEKVNLSNATAAELFYDYGTKAVTADLVRYIGTPEGTESEGTESEGTESEGTEE